MNHEDRNGARLVSFPTDRRALARRRWRDRLVRWAPALIVLVILLVLAFVFGGHPQICEPYQGC